MSKREKFKLIKTLKSQIESGQLTDSMRANLSLVAAFGKNSDTEINQDQNSGNLPFNNLNSANIFTIKNLINSSRFTSLAPKTSLTSYFVNTKNENYLIFISLLKDKCYQLYIENLNELSWSFKENYVRIKEVELIDTTQEWAVNEMMGAIMRSFRKFAFSLINYAKQLPGIGSINDQDLEKIINTSIYLFNFLKFISCFCDNECFILYEDKYRITRKWMVFIVGEEPVNALYKFCRELNKLELNTKEMSVLYPFLLCTEGIFF